MSNPTGPPRRRTDRARRDRRVADALMWTGGLGIVGTLVLAVAPWSVVFVLAVAALLVATLSPLARAMSPRVVVLLVVAALMFAILAPFVGWQIALCSCAGGFCAGLVSRPRGPR